LDWNEVYSRKCPLFKKYGASNCWHHIELAIKIMKYRALARAAASDPVTAERIAGLIVELEKRFKETDE
jgi:hypothetical protein